ncbi:hypothetical protein HDU91_000871 [Kappamyces sp. JEL0680]|nr:hypothetical protein HDU91_000871 [Kappamyces sp. JEL0680]
MTHQTTEWQDILMEKGTAMAAFMPQVRTRQLSAGIIPEITQEKLEEIVDQGRLAGLMVVIATHENGKPMEDRDLDELLELEDDDLEDDRILE